MDAAAVVEHTASFKHSAPSEAVHGSLHPPSCSAGRARASKAVGVRGHFVEYLKGLAARSVRHAVSVGVESPWPPRPGRHHSDARHAQAFLPERVHGIGGFGNSGDTLGVGALRVAVKPSDDDLAVAVTYLFKSKIQRKIIM